jgi:hypothetical protein
MLLKTRLALVVSAICLTACGGGGDSASAADVAPAVVPTKAEGYYAGTFSTSANPNGVFETIVLENDDIWALYGGRSSTGGLIVYGMVQGKGASNNGSFPGTDLRDYYSNGQVVSGSISASYVPGTSLKGNISSGNQTVAFTAAVPTTNNYSYNSVPKLADIVGSWTGFNLLGGSDTVTIQSDGSLSSVDAGCLTTGTVAPRASGKNIFDLNIRIASTAACGTSAGLTATGHVVTSLLTDGRRQLIALYVTPARDRASAFIAVR